MTENKARQIVRTASIQTDTGNNSSGLMTVEQSKRFVQMAFADTSLMSIVRRKMHISAKGEINKIGVGGRIIQKKNEGLAGDSVGVNHSVVPYNCVDVTLPWDISEKIIRQNIERQDYPNTVAAMMAKAWGLDMQDLGINGDTAYSGEDAAFINIVDGWGKKIKTSGHITVAPKLNLDLWYGMYEQLDEKYMNRKLRWMVSPKIHLAWRQFCESKALAGGNTNLYNSDAPAGIPIVPQDFRIPAVYFPSPKISSAGDTLLTYAVNYSWFVVFFDTSI